MIAGGFVAVRGRHTYGTYVLAEPDGAVHLHDKDIPTAWEQNFYVGGDDPGTPRCGRLGCTVGLMSGWEWARYGTAARVRAAKARIVIGGMCWPSMPLNWPGPLRWFSEREHGIWREQARALPGQVARLTGAPVAHASHVGPITGETPLGPGIPWKTFMLGESQVCDRDGTILARLTLEDGEGHVAADVDLREPAPLDPIRDRFWIPDMTVNTKAAWVGMNTQGALAYRLRHARHAFPCSPGRRATCPTRSRRAVPPRRRRPSAGPRTNCRWQPDRAPRRMGRMSQSASRIIIAEVTSWPGVEAGPGRRGELAFRVGRREIGHLHGDRSAHFSFPKAVWAELFEQGRSATTRSSPASPARPRAGSSPRRTCATSSRCCA